MTTCDSLIDIIQRALRANSLEGYHAAQAEVAILLLFGGLCEGHQRIAEKLINTSVELAPLFVEALREHQAVERLLAFRRNVEGATEEVKEMMRILFPGDPETLHVRIVRAATEGNLQAQLFFTMYSRTEEELDALENMRIPVHIVPDGDQ